MIVRPLSGHICLLADGILLFPQEISFELTLRVNQILISSKMETR